MNDEQKKLYNRISRVLILLICLGYLSIILIQIQCFYLIDPASSSVSAKISSSNRNVVFIDSLGIMSLIAGAVFMLGGLMGFLFGIPRINQTVEDINKSHVIQNDNLVQVSDWLTKIIVGVGLTQLYKMPNILKNMANYIHDNIFPVIVPLASIEGVIVFYIVAGFACAYLWTRIYFAKMLDLITDIESTNIQKVTKININNANVDSPPEPDEPKAAGTEM